MTYRNLKQWAMPGWWQAVVTILSLSFATLLFFSATLPGRAHLKSAARMNASTAAGLQQTPVVTVSAASYETTAIAPDSIVAAFGAQLATQTVVATALPLPTELGGTTVEVNGRRAGLFFVSPFQVNYLVPAETEVGNATVVVRSGDGTVSNGALQVRDVSPAIFTANSDGQGVPAAFLLRVNGASQQAEDVAQCVGSPRVCLARAFDLGPESEQVFLILYLSGIRRTPDPNGDGNFNENVHVVIGGNEIIPAYAGPQGTFVGLNQINVEIPRSLIGRGRVNVSVAGNGFTASRPTEIEIGARAGSAPPVISSFGPAPALAGQMLTLNGTGFSSNPAEMVVRMAGIEGRVISASASQLSIQAPFGARSGLLSVRTPQGEGASASPLAVRTSISGVIENTDRQPVSGVNVKVSGTSITARTGAEGAFILPDVAPGAAIVEVDGAAIPVSPPFPKVTLKTVVRADQDNQFARPISLQQNTGATITVGRNSLTETAVSVPVPAETRAPADTIQSGNVTFEVPANTTVSFPDGTTSGILTLTLVANSRTPVNLPFGVFSPVIAQISPFGAVLNPGGKLIFPNPDGFAAGSQVRLFRLDQTAGSPTLGTFIESGAATVSSDGQRIETATDAIKETSYYFVASPQPVTTVIGRVVDSDGSTPVRLAVVRVRGQEAFTDGNGSFILRDIPVKSAADQITVEASFVRPSGRVERTQRSGIAAVINGITTVTPDLVLPSETSNRPPVIICPPSLTVSAGQTLDVNFTAYDPDTGQTIRVEPSGAPEVSPLVVKGSGDSYNLRLALRNGLTGNFTLRLTATDNQGASATQDIPVRVNPASIACGQTRTGSFTASSQQDVYTFNGNAGEIIRLVAALNGSEVFSNLCPVLEIYDSTGRLIKMAACSGARVAETGLVTLPTTGQYVIVVRDDNFRDGGPYGLNLAFITGQCGTAITCGPTRTGSFTASSQQDIYTFSGNAGGIIRLVAALNGSPVSFNLCPVVELYNPIGGLVKMAECDPNTRVANTDLVTLPATGRYVIVVRDDNFRDGGPYGVSISCIVSGSNSSFNRALSPNKPSPNSTSTDGAAHSPAANAPRSRRKIK